MDKFGIFKLLSGFLDLYKKEGQNSVQNPSPSTKTDLDGLINSILKKPKDNAPITPTKKPLQVDMLKTMQSHDEFVKRVNKNLKNSTTLQK